jgi:hypothetical protein
LTSDVSYSFNVIPFNHATPTVPGTAVLSSTTLYTLANITSAVSLTNQTGSSIDISFAHSDLSYVTITANIGNTTTVLGPNTYTKSNLQQNYITFLGLASDVSYSFNVIPYNHATPTVPGTAILSSTTLYTLSTVNTVTLAVNDSSSIQINFGNSNLSSVSIYANLGSTSTYYNSIANVYVAPFQKPIIFQGLQPDASYTFVVVPYNHDGIPVGGVPIANTTAIYTWSYISNAIMGANAYAYGLDVSFNYTDLSYVTIAGTGVPLVKYYKPQITSSNYIHISNLAANTNYSLSIIPYNFSGVAGVTLVSPSYTTIYDISNVRMVNLSGDEIDISFNFASDVSYVKVTRANGVSSNIGNYQNVPFSTIQQTGLLPDTSYNFTLTPYNVYNITGGNQVLSNIYTLSTILSTTIGGNKYAYGIDISFIHSDLSYVTIQANANGSLVGAPLQYTKAQLVTANVQIANLTANTSYTLNIIPYNNIGNAGATSITGTYITSYDISNLRVISLSGDEIDLSFNFASDVSYINILRANGLTSNVGNYQNVPFTKIINTGLSADTSYNFTVTPYNKYNLPGIQQTINNYYTLSTVRNVSFVVNDSSSISVNFAYSNFSNVVIQANIGSTNTAFGSNIFYSPPFIFNGLAPDTSYNFMVTPYNDALVAGIPQGNTTVIYTYSYLNNVTLAVYDTSSININFANSDLSYVTIRANIGGSTVQYGTSANTYIRGFTKPILFKGLQPDVSYSFVVTPYNHANIAGFSLVTASTEYTWSSVSGVYYNVYDSSSIAIYFGNTDLSYVSIQANIGSTSSVVGSNIYSKGFTSPIIFNGLSTDASYSFSVTPYNHKNVAGNIVANTTAVYTLSYVNNVIISVNDSSSILIDFSNSDLSYVTIRANIGGTTTQYGTSANTYSKGFSKPILFTGLQQDASYSFVVTPYNHATTSVAGTPVVSSTKYTLATLPNLFISNVTSTSMDLSFTPVFDFSYASIQITNGTNVVTNNYYRSSFFNLPITLSGLTTDTSYSLVVTPYNHTGVANTPVSINSNNVSNIYLINNKIFNDPGLDYIVRKKSPWGIYDAALWTGTTLPEARGNGRTVTSTGTITSSSASGNGATVSIPYIYGDTTTTMSWPSGSIPTNFTICSISRYTGGTNKRILVGKNSNWLHGHWSNNRGVAFYQGWKTNQTSYGNLTDWLVMCGNNGSTIKYSNLEDSNPVGIASGGQGNDIFGINNCSQTSGEQSTWQLSYVMIWDQVLTDAEMLIVSKALQNYLSTGVIYKTPDNYPIYTLSTASSLIATYIAYNEIDISFNYSDLSYIFITSSPEITTGGNITPQLISKANISLPIRYTGLTTGTNYTFNVIPYNHGSQSGNTVSLSNYTSYILGNVVAQYDTSPSNIILSGSNVTRWNCINSATYNFTTSSAAGTVTTFTYNGLNMLNLTSNIATLGSASIACNGFISVINPKNNGTGGIDMLLSVSTTGDTSFRHARLSTTGSRNANDYDNSTSSYIYINGTYYPYTSQNYDNTDRYVILYVNFATSISFTTIGSTLFSRGFKGYIGDLICLNSSHTTNDRLALEGYLATKWNLQGSLPTNHPYYTLNQSIVFAYTPSISSVTTTNINYHSIDISFSQVNTSYIRIVSSPSVTLNSSYSGTSPITISGLTMGTAYVFTLTPYNLADTAGTPVATPSATTLNPILSVVATSSIGLYSTNITFTQIDTSYILISSTPSVSSLSNPYSTTSPISISGLTYNTAYTFYLTPYNSSNEPGSQVSTSITTLRPTITGVSTTTTTTSINISFSQSNVSYINITSNPTLTLNNPYNNPISPIVISGLSVDTSYNFTLTPYTSIGEPGSQVSIPTTYTLSYVNPVTITANDASSMNINFTSSDLSYVTIRANIGGTATQYGTTANIYSKGYSMPIVFSGLNIDSSYSFVVTPYNHATTSVAGTPIISSTTEYTLATLPNLFVTNVTSTSMDLSFTPVFDFSYASVKINNGVPTKYYRSSFFNLPITLSGLTTDTSYSLVVTPYNHTGVANTPVSLNTSKPYFTNIQYNNTSLNSIVQNISPWGIYDAALWNPTTNILPEARGNGRDVTSTGTITNGKASGNGATASVPYIYGDTTTTMSWPSGSIPTNFTICSISRYTGGTNNRILVAKNYNWLHGHHGGSRGRAYYNGWKTNQTSYGTLTDWLVMCGNNGTSVANSILEDSNPVGISSGGQGNDIFGINNCSGINEQSTWQLSYVIIWDQVLTDTDMLSVSNALLNYLSTGILYSNNSTYYTPIYTLSTISNLISTYITYNEIDISFNYSDLSYVYITSNPQITTGGNITPQTISKANIRLPIRYTGLTGTTTYSFNLTPYNHGLINCITVSNSYPTLTLPLLSSVSTNISINSIDISFTPSNVSYINISSSPSVSLNSSYGNTSPITITGLTVNSSYTFTLTPYASDNQVGTAVNISFTTLPYINTQSNAITSTETYSGNNYYIVKFTSSGSVKFNSNMNANVLIVGGGGYGGVCINNRASGGGGGGEVKTGSMTFTSGNTYSITIGTGSTSISNVVTGTSATKITSNIDTRANVVCYGGGNGTDVQSDGAYTLAIGGGNNGGGGGGYNSTTSWVYTAGSNGQSGINNVYNLTSFSNNAGGLGGYQTGGGGGGGAGGSGGDYVSNNNTSGPIGGAGGAGYTWLNGNTYAYGGRGFGYINTASSSYTGNQKLTYGSGGDAGTSGHSGINGIVIIAIRI